MAKITVDGRIIEVKDSDNLLEALLGLGEDLPYFCWHPEMGSVGACRQCAVVQYMNEDDTRGRIVMSCMTAVTEGAIFSVQGDKASEFRESVVENLMLNHPHDCPVCEEGGECHLQDMTVMTGHRDRKYRHLKTTFRNQYLGPLIGHEMNRCITCYRCVRYYGDYAGGDDLAAFASRDRVFFGRSGDGVLENEFAGNLVEVCPTGVFTDKTLSEHYTRKWDLQSAPAICTGCSVGCNIIVSERYGQVRRVTNRYHGEINGYFLCDRGRFGAQYVNSEDRIPYCGIRNDSNIFEAISKDDALTHIQETVNNADTIVGIGSPRASLEANFALRTLVGKENFYSGLSPSETEIASLLLSVLRSEIKVPTLKEVESCDAVLILGEDTTNHAPRLALSIRQASRNEAKSMAKDAGIPLWQDAAVRKLAQDICSPVFILTPYDDRLDDVGIPSRLSPNDISNAGFNIAHAINESFPSGTDQQFDTAEIVSALKGASNPLIVTGSSLSNPEIVKAATNIANALAKHNENTALLICTDGPNALAASLLSDQSFPSTSPELAIVVENDLSNVPSATLKHWLEGTKQLLVIDSLDNALSTQSNIVLPAATFAEAEGTYINLEGRAQRSFGAYKPKGDIAASWQWLLEICHDQGSLNEVAHIDDLLAHIAVEEVELAGIVDAAPGAHFKHHGQKISRMTHRYSGRTAMLADKSVHEPQQPADDDSALSYSMEGTNQSDSTAMQAYTWSPGWNSNQSINKFQDDIAGSLRHGDPGIRLFSGKTPVDQFRAGSTTNNKADVISRWHIFGSDSLSNKSPAINSLAPTPYALLNADMAESLGVQNGDGLKLEQSDDAESAPSLEVIVDDAIPAGCIVCPVLDETRLYFNENDFNESALVKDENWAAASDADFLIASDRGS
ncbi:MAG: NADH-quinone oxidoreductase subunit NuoG [Pseudomonadales bacterium]|jgi:NADH-quinone oxidoreductase subunit G